MNTICDGQLDCGFQLCIGCLDMDLTMALPCSGKASWHITMQLGWSENWPVYRDIESSFAE
jgi:hypothetical protein